MAGASKTGSPPPHPPGSSGYTCPSLSRQRKGSLPPHTLVPVGAHHYHHHHPPRPPLALPPCGKMGCITPMFRVVGICIAAPLLGVRLLVYNRSNTLLRHNTNSNNNARVTQPDPTIPGSMGHHHHPHHLVRGGVMLRTTTTTQPPPGPLPLGTLSAALRNSGGGTAISLASLTTTPQQHPGGLVVVTAVSYTHLRAHET